MAAAALGLSTEEFMTALGGVFVKAAFRWLRGRNGELIEMERRQI